MLRKIIEIDQERCTGCGICADACHEGAIGMVDGKARLLRDDCCDGLGDCLPACPAEAISFVEREAAAYDEAAAWESMRKAGRPRGGGCPGSMVQTVGHAEEPAAARSAVPVSRLGNWPVQIRLAPVSAPYFDGAKLLIAADCTAYAYANFHQEFMCGKVTLAGCPKLDGVDYGDKLAAILRSNDIQSVVVVRMEVPCCGGLEMAAKRALQDSGKSIPWQVMTISVDGRILGDA